MDIQPLLNNPETFVNTLYTIKSISFFQNIIQSPYLKIDDPELTCILSNECPNPINRLKIKENTYRITLQNKSYLLQIVKVKPFISLSYTPNTNINLLKDYTSSLKLCLYGNFTQNQSYIQSDEYTNNLLISSILKYIYSQIPKSAGLH